MNITRAGGATGGFRNTVARYPIAATMATTPKIQSLLDSFDTATSGTI
jgi:hypothetical protein